MKKISWLFLALFFGNLFSTIGQNTVGLISINQEETIGGYNLIYPENQSSIFLINECGELVKEWEDTPENRPGKVAYFFDNGNILRSKNAPEDISGSSFGAGGTGGVVEIIDWENNSLWKYVVADSTKRQHHDVHIMPNGNVLILAWEVIGLQEMVENGFDSTSFEQEEYWPDYIFEINPNNNEIVWEWHAWDHLIQDHDSTKLNYGVINEHPELIDINYNQYSAERSDWMHSNAIDYDPVKDQVILSTRNFAEIWIIDHSTTTAEAAGNTGGNSGRGGDLLFRWGNPHAYKMGEISDRKLFSQHDAQWIDDFVDPEYEYYGEIVLFNNFIDNSFSLGQILEPVWNETNQSYLMENGIFLPEGFSEDIAHPNPDSTYSPLASSIQILGDGHTVICAARIGFSYELTPEGNVAWEYRTPIRNGFPIEQGNLIGLSENFTFQIERYPEDFPGFAGRDIYSIGFIELNPNGGICDFTNIDENYVKPDILAHPNPASDYLWIKNNEAPFEILITNLFGETILNTRIENGENKINVSDWAQGIYFISGENGIVQKKIIVN